MAQPSVAGTPQWTKYGSGFTWDLSEEQTKILADFEKSAAAEIEAVRFPHEPAHECAARFLRARKYDTEKATEMIRHTAEWRRTSRIDELRTKTVEEIIGCPVDELLHFYPQCYPPVFDREGRPVYIERTGQIDVHSLMCSTTQEGLINWHLKLFASRTPAAMARGMASRGDGRIVNSTTTILDLEGFSMGMLMGATQEYLGKLTKIDQDHFPEVMGCTLIINAPTIFSVAWGIVKNFLDARTVEKIRMKGSDYKEALFEILGGPERTPRMYGGTLDVPGMFASGMTAHAVHSGAKHAIAIRAATGRVLRVRWNSNPADIVFGVVAITGDAATLARAAAEPATFTGGSTEVVYAPKAHPDSNTTTTEVKSEAKAETVFIITWDNSAGWKQRVVHYLAGLIPTREEAAVLYLAECREYGLDNETIIRGFREHGYPLPAELEGGAAAAAAASSSSSSASGAGDAGAAAAAASSSGSA